MTPIKMGREERNSFTQIKLNISKISILFIKKINKLLMNEMK